MNSIFAFFVIFPPLLSVFFGLLFSYSFGSIKSKRLVNYFSCGMILISSLSSFLFLYSFLTNQRQTLTFRVLEWISINNQTIYWSIHVDQMIIMMLCLITSVSFLVHLYSIEYMKNEHLSQRFMINISFFTFAMIILVTSSNFLQLFFGWECVGFTSYLLIGYFYKRKSASIASMKAFIVNRISDSFMIFGIILICYSFGDLNIDIALSSSRVQSIKDSLVIFSIFNYNFTILDLICVCLLIGCFGKSAQILFHIWLPDAMEGPTPVSALIHAATMVTAGIFLICRCANFFDASEISFYLISGIGIFTAFFAGAVAMTQKDIKKIIAYSTCSQLGYIFLACGIRSYSSGIFHLLTHGFFKALLFLTAGSIIHSINTQNVFEMGNLKKYMPVTFFSMLIGTFAICGIPPFSGFYSKDAIFESLLVNFNEPYSRFLFIALNLIVIMTSFYSFRLLFLVFFGKENFSLKERLPHESKYKILLPLIILSFFATISGHFIEKVLNINLVSDNFIMTSIRSSKNISLLNRIASNRHTILNYFPLFSSIFGIFISYVVYFSKNNINVKISSTFFRIYSFLFNKWYFDEFYRKVFILPYQNISSYLGGKFDICIFDKYFVDIYGSTLQKISHKTRFFQSGSINIYALIVLSFIIFLVFII